MTDVTETTAGTGIGIGTGGTETGIIVQAEETVTDTEVTGTEIAIIAEETVIETIGGRTIAGTATAARVKRERREKENGLIAVVNHGSTTIVSVDLRKDCKEQGLWALHIWFEAVLSLY
mmetsp:Transcript_7849/g.9104  ORF Transcript_7849/g.9104 Transcript_7849/m.9104 type:complete len:119 (+) Transcript_7849:373-729(+)